MPIADALLKYLTNHFFTRRGAVSETIYNYKASFRGGDCEGGKEGTVYSRSFSLFEKELSTCSKKLLQPTVL